MSVVANTPSTMPLPLASASLLPTRLASSRVVPTPAPSPSAIALLAQAKQELGQAAREQAHTERFAGAHLSALRGAAAVLALRGRPHRGRAKPTSAWVLLAKLAPELSEWAAFFQSCSANVGAIRAGITRVVTPRAADDLLYQTGQFLDLVDHIVHQERAAHPQHALNHSVA